MNLREFEMYLIHQGLEPYTRRRCLDVLSTIEQNCDMSSEDSVRDFVLSKIEQSKSVYNHFIKGLRHWYLFQEKSVPSWCKQLREDPKARIMLSDAEIEALIEVDPAPSRYGVFWTILAYMGLRTGELRCAKVEDIDFGLGAIYIHKTKTHTARKVPFPEHLRASIEEYCRCVTGEYLFPSPRGNTAVTQAAYMKDWKRRLKKLGITKKVTPYSMRHSFITNSLGNGANLFAIQDMVGHSSADTTRLYYHGNIDMMRKAAAKLPLAEKNSSPRELAEIVIGVIDTLSKDPRFDPIELLEAKKHVYQAMKKPEKLD